MISTPQEPADRALLRRAEIRAEQLVAFLRMVVSAALFGAILVTTSFDTQMAVFRLGHGGITLGAYFLLGLVSWLACRCGVFRHWMAWPAALADSLFFLSDLWLRIHDAAFPGSLSFMFPSMWLILLVFSFGALRINPYLQGVVATITVAGLIAVLGHDPGALRGFAHAGVLDVFAAFPANMMRVSIIALGAAILVTSTFRARRRMMDSIHEARRNANLTRYLPEQVAAALADSGLDALRRGGQTDMGILFIDIRGFTRWSQNRSPQEVHALMSTFRAHVMRVARDTGGVIDKFIGDAAMILFPKGDDPKASAQASMECAVRLSDAMADWSDERRKGGLPAVRVGIGLHWGEVFSGVIGDEHRLEYSVFGDAVNTASRLEELARNLDMEIIASCKVLERCSDTGEAVCPPDGWESLGAVAIRGRSGTLEIFGRPLLRPPSLGDGNP